MSWLENLNNINLTSSSLATPMMTAATTTTWNYYETVPLYIDGVNIDIELLLKRLQCNYNWINISQITYNYLMQRYKNNVDKVEKYIFNERNDNIIYMGVCECFQVNRLVRKYAATKNNTTINTNYIMKFYNDCCDTLKIPSNDKSIIFINVDINYCCDLEALLRTIAYMSLLSKKHLYPLMDIIIIEKCTEEDENNNISNNNDCGDRICANRNCNEINKNNIRNILLKFKDYILKDCCSKIDYRLYTNYNIETLFDIIAKAYRSDDFYTLDRL
jgi:hypothetical protein